MIEIDESVTNSRPDLLPLGRCRSPPSAQVYRLTDREGHMSCRHTEAFGLLTAFALLGSFGCDSSSPTANSGEAIPTVLTDQKTVNLPFNASNFVAAVTNP